MNILSNVGPKVLSEAHGSGRAICADKVVFDGGTSS